MTGRMETAVFQQRRCESVPSLVYVTVVVFYLQDWLNHRIFKLTGDCDVFTLLDVLWRKATQHQ